MNRAARPVMRGRQAGVRGRLTSTFKALVIPELREHKCSGRRSDPWDRFQQVSVASEGIGALDVLVNRFFKLVDLLVDAFEHRLKRAGNRWVFRLADLVFQAVALLFELFKAAGQLLQAFLLRRCWFPWGWFLALTKACEETSVHLVGFRTGELAVSVGARALGVDDRHGQPALVQKASNWTLIPAGRLQTNVNLLRRILQAVVGLLLNPTEERFESLLIVREAPGGGVFPAEQCNFERRLAYIDTHRQAGRSRRFGVIGSGHCEIQTNEYRLNDWTQPRDIEGAQMLFGFERNEQKRGTYLTNGLTEVASGPVVSIRLPSLPAPSVLGAI